MSEWQTIDTAPRDGTVILGWRFYVVAMKWTGDAVYPWEAVSLDSHPCTQFSENGFMEHDASLSHWAPLPEPPQ